MSLRRICAPDLFNIRSAIVVRTTPFPADLFQEVHPHHRVLLSCKPHRPGLPYLPNSSWMVLQGIPCSNSFKSLRGLTWYRNGSSGLGAKPFTAMPSCITRVTPLCQISMSRRSSTAPLSSRDFALSLSCPFQIPTSCPKNGRLPWSTKYFLFHHVTCKPARV